MVAEQAHPLGQAYSFPYNDYILSQNAFTALAYLFKFLWRRMLRDIDNIFE